MSTIASNARSSREELPLRYSTGLQLLEWEPFESYVAGGGVFCIIF